MIAEALLAIVSALPQAPQPQPKFGKVDWTLIAADASVRALDVYSTHQMLKNGYHEIVLPKFIADHTPAMAAYSTGCVASDYMVARMLIKHHHPKLARIVVAVDASQDAYWAVHNLTLKQGKR
jgi:hypothetical protein